MRPLIEIKNICFGYEERNGGREIIKDISLSIFKGEFVAVVGPNGGGKSTLVRHINGLLTPCSGSVIVKGLDTRDYNNLPAIRRMVGMVFQNPDSQIFASIVEEDVAFGLENMCLDPSDIRERVDKSLSRLGLLKYKNHPPQRLSGGQRQKVAIAGIVAMEPDCIILDEPTSMLDYHGKKEVMEAVWDLNKKNEITVVHVTHDMTEALFATRILAVVDGRIVYDGEPEEFFSDQQLLRDTGMQLPPIKELIFNLVSAGFNLPKGTKRKEELVEALCQLF